jgi:glyoxylase-like metal-dependent hydrolase (beta-lactamase superfamily II)
MILRALVSGALALLASCHIRDAILRQTFVSGADYSVPPGVEESVFAKHTANIYSYRYRFYRTLIVDTAEGLVIIDPMNSEVSKRARAILQEKFPGKPVHTVFYSHYHLDHVIGAGVYSPQNVIAHERAPQYWEDMDASGVLPPTRTLRGDQGVIIGGVEIRLLDQGLSHTDTLFSFYFPGERLVYAPDVGFVKSWPTPGPFDTYYYGYVRAMERLAALDFDTFVPSHGEVGVKEDLAFALAFYKDVRAIMTAAIQRSGDVETGEGLQKIFDEAYPVLKKKYGHLHGFAQMAPLGMVRQMAGINLGY